MKEHVDVLKDSFVDYAGKTHHFVIAAITSNLTRDDEDLPCVVDSVSCWSVVEKGIRLGISICNPEDEFTEKIGVMKALNRARNSDIIIYATNGNYIREELVKALLLQEANHIKAFPGHFIKGYEDSKERYLRNKKMEELKNNFSDIENLIISNVQKDPKFLDNVNVYLDWVNNQNKGKCKKH